LLIMVALIGLRARELFKTHSRSWQWQNFWAPSPAQLNAVIATINLDQLMPDFQQLLILNENAAFLNPAVLTPHIRYYRKIIEYYPELGEAYALLGFCHYHRGNIPEAIAELRHATESLSGLFWPHYNLGVIYLKGGDRKKAADSFQSALNTPFDFTLLVITHSKIYQEIFRPAHYPDERIAANLAQTRNDCTRIIALLRSGAPIPEALIQSLYPRNF